MLSIACKYFTEFILNNPDKPWNWRLLSNHPCIDEAIISKLPDKPWYWWALPEGKQQIKNIVSKYEYNKTIDDIAPIYTRISRNKYPR